MVVPLARGTRSTDREYLRSALLSDAKPEPAQANAGPHTGDPCRAASSVVARHSGLAWQVYSTKRLRILDPPHSIQWVNEDRRTRTIHGIVKGVDQGLRAALFRARVMCSALAQSRSASKCSTPGAGSCRSVSRNSRPLPLSSGSVARSLCFACFDRFATFPSLT